MKKRVLSFGITAVLALSALVFTGCGGDSSSGGGGGGNPPGDTTRPTVLSTSPASGATGVAINAHVTATFSEAMNAATIAPASFTVSGVTGSVTCAGATATFTPSSNLATNTTYTATITTAAKDSAGNALAAAKVWSFRTGASADLSAPTVPAGLTATAASASQINLAWSASTDDVGVTGYKVYKGGAFLKTVAGTSASDTGLTASTNYCYAVSAIDAAGNESAQSTQDCATTNAGAATLVSIAVTPANPSIAVNATQQFTATGTYSDTSTANITGTVTWSSGDTGKATISAGGLATGVAAGQATITATSGTVSNHTTLTVTGGGGGALAWTANSIGSTQNLGRIAWSGSAYVAAAGMMYNAKYSGYYAAVATSSDGTTWTLNWQDERINNMYDLLWDGAQFIGLGAWGQDYSQTCKSTDGTTWSNASPSSNTSMFGYSIAWSDTLHLYVAAGKGIATSPDAVTWTARSTVAGLAKVIWTGTQFVAVGSSTKVMTSPDGITWTDHSPTFWTKNLTGVAWSGTQLVAVGGMGAVITSPDGVTWTDRTVSDPTHHQFKAIVWSSAKQKFAVVDNDTTTGIYGIYTINTSADAAAWTVSYTPSSGKVNDVIADGTGFAATGDQGMVYFAR